MTVVLLMYNSTPDFYLIHRNTGVMVFMGLCVLIPLSPPGVHFSIGQQETLSGGITSATIKLDHVSMKPMQRATAAKTAPTVPLHTDHMTCAALSMTSGTPDKSIYKHLNLSVCVPVCCGH